MASKTTETRFQELESKLDRLMTIMEAASGTPAKEPAKPERKRVKSKKEEPKDSAYGPIEASDVANISNFRAKDPIVVADALLLGVSKKDKHLAHIGLVKRNQTTGEAFMKGFNGVTAEQLDDIIAGLELLRDELG